MEFLRSNVNFEEVLVQLLAFIILFWVLKLLAWNKILAVLENRREKIRLDLEKIEKAQKGVEALKAEYALRIQHIEEEAHKKLQEAIADGKRISHEIHEEARRHAYDILEKAKDDIELEIEKARITLRDQIANLTLAATERLLGKKLDETSDKEIVEEFIRNLEKKP